MSLCHAGNTGLIPALSAAIVHFSSSHARVPLHAERGGVEGARVGEEERGEGGFEEEKEAVIDVSHRHLALSLQLIGPTSIQQCCRLFLCKHKHGAKSVPALHCLPGSRSALFCLNLK